MVTQSPPRPNNPMDCYAPSFDVTDTLVLVIDEEPETLREALEALDLTAPVVRALEALGATDRLALAPTLLAIESGPALVFGLVWRYDGPAAAVDPARVRAFDIPGHVKVIWNVQVRPGGLEGAVLSSTRRFAATDDAARARLLDGWGVIGTVAKSVSRRILATIEMHAEECAERGRAPDSLSAEMPSASMLSTVTAA